MSIFLAAAFIFCMRIGDVSIGTMRVLFMVQGRKVPAACLALVESGIWILAAAQVFKNLNSWPNMIGYCTGFATGTLIGMSLEQWIAYGRVLVRVVSRDDDLKLRELLASHGFGVTEFTGTGVGGKVFELLVVTTRRRKKEAIELVRSVDHDAFITVEGVNQIVGGFVSRAASAGGLRK